MIRFVITPHLPQGNVKQIIIGKKYENMLKNASLEYNFELICLDDNPYVDERLSGHTDLMAVHLGDNRLALRPFLRSNDRLRELGAEIVFTEDNGGNSYPNDAALNFCVVGKRLIYNDKSANDDIVNQLTNINSKIKCKQGYTKCSTCVVDERSIITVDGGIAKAASLSGLNVLHIENAEIKLSGFDKGFIGGASFKIAPDIMAFTGYIINNNVRDQIESFLSERGIKAIYLNDCPAFDIGSAIPLTEEA